MFNFTDSNPKTMNTTISTASSESSSRKTLLEQVFDAVQTYGEPITCREVVDLLGPDVNAASVSSYLNQLTAVGVLQCVKPAEGSRRYSVIAGKTLADFSSTAYKEIARGKPSKRTGRGYNGKKAAALPDVKPAPTSVSVEKPMREVCRAAAPEGVRVEAQVTLHVAGQRITLSMGSARQLFDALKAFLT